MTKEEAINRLKSDVYEYMEFATNPNADEFEKAFDMAIEALQKQIPKQPTIENGFVKCPTCEKYIRFPIADRYNNCPECGQALKWEGEEE